LRSREYILETRYLMRGAKERIGEALAGESDEVRVAAAREVIKRRLAVFNQTDIESLRLGVAEIEIAAIEAAAAMSRKAESGSEPIEFLYPPSGVEFGALDDLEQIGQDAVGWGWTGEDLYRLSLELAGGSELFWLTSEYAEIRTPTNQIRKVYRRY
jgi:hypothetical protein